MWRVVEEFHERLTAAPERVLVVDDDGEHTAAEVASAANAVRDTLRAAVGAAPTVAAEAPNDHRTMVIALAVGELGGNIGRPAPGARAGRG